MKQRLNLFWLFLIVTASISCRPKHGDDPKPVDNKSEIRNQISELQNLADDTSSILDSLTKADWDIDPALAHLIPALAAIKTLGKVEIASLRRNAVPTLERKVAQDFSKMPIEDAIMYMFMLISEDARADLKEMLEEMDSTREKKKALRDKAQIMKDRLVALRERMKTEFNQSAQTKTTQAEASFSSALSSQEYWVSSTSSSKVTDFKEPAELTPLFPNTVIPKYEIDCSNTALTSVQLLLKDHFTDAVIDQSVEGQSRASVSLSASAQREFRAIDFVVRIKGKASAKIEKCWLKRPVYVDNSRVKSFSPEKAQIIGRQIGLLNEYSVEIADKIAEAQRSQSFSEADSASVGFTLKDVLKSRNRFNQILTYSELQKIEDKIEDKMDSLSDSTELMQLRLQSYMDRRAKVFESISNLMKKFSDTQSTITSNLK